MSARSFSILAGGTLSASGGSAVTYADDGLTVQNGVHVVDTSATDMRIQPSITLQNRKATLRNGLYINKDKRSAVVQIPLLKTDGTVVNNLVRIERELDPSTTAAQALEITLRAAQTLFDSELASFWATGSVS